MPLCILSAISEYSHKDMSWLASKDSEVIDYELAFYREPPLSARTYESEDRERILRNFI